MTDPARRLTLTPSLPVSVLPSFTLPARRDDRRDDPESSSLPTSHGFLLTGAREALSQEEMMSDVSGHFRVPMAPKKPRGHGASKALLRSILATNPGASASELCRQLGVSDRQLRRLRAAIEREQGSEHRRDDVSQRRPFRTSKGPERTSGRPFRTSSDVRTSGSSLRSVRTDDHVVEEDEEISSSSSEEMIGRDDVQRRPKRTSLEESSSLREASSSLRDDALLRQALRIVVQEIFAAAMPETPQVRKGPLPAARAESREPESSSAPPPTVPPLAPPAAPPEVAPSPESRRGPEPKSWTKEQQTVLDWLEAKTKIKSSKTTWRWKVRQDWKEHPEKYQSFRDEMEDEQKAQRARAAAMEKTRLERLAIEKREQEAAAQGMMWVDGRLVPRPKSSW